MIRKMQKKDLKGVKLLIQSVPGLWHDIYTDETIARAFVSSEDLAFVYDSNGQIVGGIFAHDLGFKGFLGMLAVSEKMQYHGIGKQLLEYVEDILRKRGCELIVSDVWKSAENFYKKCGWDYPQTVLLRKKLSDK
ncbi:MAG: GNAT family N-acetyltransferase [bacterium]